MTSALRTLSWAVYLAMSWTWCIGMFMPVILVSEFGIGGWFVFSIPNILGAAAMGWVLARPGASERIVLEHHTACVAFSTVTLAFQAFFLFWLAEMQVVPAGWAITAVVAGIVVGCVKRGRDSWDLVLAWLVLAVSLGVLGKALTHVSIPNMVGESPLSATASLWCLSPVCAFGFLLCPYLDVTFHRAKQATSPEGGRAAFTLGFGFFFLLMLLLTLLYAGDLTTGGGSFGRDAFVSWIGLHICVQIGFKFAAHLRALPTGRRSDLGVWLVPLIMLLASVIALAVLRDRAQQIFTGQLIYRMFMSFYGLIFPAYVWVCMVPIFGPAPGTTRPAVTAWIVGLIIAGPMFWLGFIDEKMLWLIAGTTVVLASRALLLFHNPKHSGVPYVSAV